MSQLIDCGAFEVVFEGDHFEKNIKFNVQFENSPIVLCGLSDTGPYKSNASLSAMPWRVTEENFEVHVKPILDAKPPEAGIGCRWIAIGTAKKS